MLTLTDNRMPGVLEVFRNAFVRYAIHDCCCRRMCTIFLTGFDLDRKDASLFLFYYAAYLVFDFRGTTGTWAGLKRLFLWCTTLYPYYIFRGLFVRF